MSEAQAATPLPQSSDAGKYEAFISYAREDRVIVERLAAALDKRGRNVWLDVEDIVGGADWRARVKRGIEACRAFVFVIGPESVRSAPCREELEQAETLNKLVIPVCRSEVEQNLLPGGVAWREWIFMRDEDDFDRSVSKLIEALDTDVAWRDKHTRLAGRAREWLDEGRDRSYLVRGSDLADALEWLADSEQHREQPTAEHRAFIAASRLHARLRRRLAVGAAVLLLAAATVTAVLLSTASEREQSQRRLADVQRRAATSRALAARAVTATRRNLDVGALLSLEAYRMSPTAEARDAILSALPHLDRAAGLLRGHRDSVDGLSISPDGRTLASAGRDGTVRLWDLAQRQETKELLADRLGVKAVAYSPDGRMLAIGGAGTLRLLDVDSGTPRTLAKRPASQVWAVRFTPNGEFVVAAINGGVEIFRVADGTRVGRPLSGTNTAIFSLAVAENGDLVFSNADGSVWTAAVTDARARRLSDPGEGVSSVAISPDGEFVAIATAKDVRLWSIAHRQQVARLGSPATAVAFSPSGDVLATAGRTITFWDTRTRKRIDRPLVTRQGDIVSLAFAPDGATLASGGTDGSIWLSDASRRRAITRPLEGLTNIVQAVAYSPDGKVLATGGLHGSVQLWDAATRRRLAVLGAHSQSVDAIAFAPDGRVLASAADFADKSLRLWDIADERLVARIRRPTKEPDEGAGNSLAFSPDGKLIASTSGDGKLQLWDPTARAPRGETIAAHKDLAMGVAFARDGDRVISGGYDGMVRFWDADTGRETGTPISIDGVITSIAVSPDGKLLATAGDQFVQLWRLATRRALGQPIGASDADPGAMAARLWDVAFSPDGRTLATASEDHSVRFFDVALQRQLGATVQAHRERVTSIAFSPDGRHLVSASEDGTVMTWDSIIWGRDFRSFQRLVCAGVRHDLTQAQWAQYLPGEPYRHTCVLSRAAGG